MKCNYCRTADTIKINFPRERVEVVNGRGVLVNALVSVDGRSLPVSVERCPSCMKDNRPVWN